LGLEQLKDFLTSLQKRHWPLEDRPKKRETTFKKFGVYTINKKKKYLWILVFRADQKAAVGKQSG